MAEQAVQGTMAEQEVQGAMVEQIVQEAMFPSSATMATGMPPHKKIYWGKSGLSMPGGILEGALEERALEGALEERS